MIQTIKLGPNARDPYCSICNSNDFEYTMCQLNASRFIISKGRDDISNSTRNSVFYVQPENVATHYRYFSIGNGELDIIGPKSSIKKFKKRFLEALAQ
jgi:hypothetical protein